MDTKPWIVKPTAFEKLGERDWIDRDEVMLHYAFQILCDFVEREDDCLPIKPDEWPNLREHDPVHAHEVVRMILHQEDMKKKARSLYEWWKNVYLPHFARDDFGFAGEREDEAQDKFLQLVEIRRFLWT